MPTKNWIPIFYFRIFCMQNEKCGQYHLLISLPINQIDMLPASWMAAIRQPKEMFSVVWLFFSMRHTPKNGIMWDISSFRSLWKPPHNS